MLLRNNLLMQQVQNDGAAAGAGQSGGILFGGGGGSGTPSGAAPSGGGNSGSGAANTDPNPNVNSQGNANTDWRLGLPDELRNEGAFKSINDISTLAKSYLHAQKLVGADKIPVPSKHATKEDWKAVYQKLGLPIDMKDYTVKEPEALKGEFTDKFKEAAWKAGILPTQAQEVLEWFAHANTDKMAQMKAEQEKMYGQQVEGLKKEWGEAFDVKLSQARQIIQKFGDDDLTNHLKESGLGNDVKLVKFLSRIGESLKESGIVGNEPNMSNAKAPAEALKEIRNIQANAEHPYNLKTHPNHDAAVKEVQRLFEQAYPEST